MNPKKKQPHQNRGLQSNKSNQTVNSQEDILNLLDKDDFTNDDLKKIAVKISQQTTTTTISGPIPDPITFGLYEKILPGSAKDILDEFKEQSKHRRNIEAIVIQSREKQSSIGQIMAFILGLFALFGSVYLAVIGERTIAGMLATTLISLTGSYFYGVFKNNKSLKDKNISDNKESEGNSK